MTDSTRFYSFRGLPGIVLAALLLAHPAFAALGVNWLTVGGGILHWEANNPPLSVSDGLDGGEIWQLILTLDGTIYPVDPVDPLVPSGAAEILVAQVAGQGPIFSIFNKTSGYVQGFNGEALPTNGLVSAYIRVIDLAPTNAPTHAFSYYDRSVDGNAAVSNITAYVDDGTPPPVPTVVDLLAGAQFGQMVLVRAPVAILGYSPDLGNPGTIDIHWQSEMGTTYSLQYTTDFLSWVDLAGATGLVAATPSLLVQVQLPDPFFAIRIRRHN
jgi:hypothetical protein